MSEVLVSYSEVNSKDQVVFINDGTIDDDTFEIIRGLSETIDEYVSLDIITDSETAEQFIVAVGAYAADEELYDIDDEDDMCPVMVDSVIKFNGQFLVRLSSTFIDEDGEDYESDDDDDSDDDEGDWEVKD